VRGTRELPENKRGTSACASRERWPAASDSGSKLPHSKSSATADGQPQPGSSLPGDTGARLKRSPDAQSASLRPQMEVQRHREPAESQRERVRSLVKHIFLGELTLAPPAGGAGPRRATTGVVALHALRYPTTSLHPPASPTSPVENAEGNPSNRNVPIP